MGALKPTCAPLPDVRHVESNSIARRQRAYGAVRNQRSAGPNVTCDTELCFARGLGCARRSPHLFPSHHVQPTPLFPKPVRFWQDTNCERYGDGPSRSCRNSRLHTIVVLVHARLTVPNLKFLQLYPLSQRAQLKDGAHPQH
jgi:hypothetical protein